MTDQNTFKEVNELKNKYDLDDGISELVYYFNKYGFTTIYSCQGHDRNKHPYIMFDAEEKEIKTLLQHLYKKFQNKEGQYLDIGKLYKQCEPVLVKNDKEELIFNNHWLWDDFGLWKVEDYQSKIDKLCNYLKQL